MQTANKSHDYSRILVYIFACAFLWPRIFISLLLLQYRSAYLTSSTLRQWSGVLYQGTMPTSLKAYVNDKNMRWYSIEIARTKPYTDAASVTYIIWWKLSNLSLSTLKWPRCPFYVHGSTLITSWVSNYIRYKVWGETTYPFPNFNGSAFKLWNFINNSI